MRRPFFLCASLSLALALPRLAWADDPVARARILFNTGAQAYAAGRYDEAVLALSAAYSLTPDRSTVVFSLAQAERRQYTVSHEARYLRAALDHFRKYLALVPEGGRRGDAVEALGELEAIEARLEKAAPEPAAEPPPLPASRITVTVAARGALISLDGREGVVSPLVEAVTPGPHLVRVSAPGFIEEERTITAVEGLLVPVEVELRARPSYLALAAPAGALITIDGSTYGESEGTQRIELPPGGHFVAVTERGRRPRVERVKIGQGEVLPLEVNLETSPQRYASLALYGGGAALVLGGVSLAIAAGRAQSIALGVRQEASRDHISQFKLDQYNDARSLRDGTRFASGVVFGVAGAMGIAATALFFLDVPSPPKSPQNPWGIARGAVAFSPGGGVFRVEGFF